jgi:hypothetical protein
MTAKCVISHREGDPSINHSSQLAIYFPNWAVGISRTAIRSFTVSSAVLCRSGRLVISEDGIQAEQFVRGNASELVGVFIGLLLACLNRGVQNGQIEAFRFTRTVHSLLMMPPICTVMW